MINHPDGTADDAYTVGDPVNVDRVELGYLQGRMDAALLHPEGDERSLAVLGLLHEMYGHELKVI